MNQNKRTVRIKQTSIRDIDISIWRETVFLFSSCGTFLKFPFLKFFSRKCNPFSVGGHTRTSRVTPRVRVSLQTSSPTFKCGHFQMKMNFVVPFFHRNLSGCTLRLHVRQSQITHSFFLVTIYVFYLFLLTTINAFILLLTFTFILLANDFHARCIWLITAFLF